MKALYLIVIIKIFSSNKICKIKLSQKTILIWIKEAKLDMLTYSMKIISSFIWKIIVVIKF